MSLYDKLKLNYDKDYSQTSTDDQQRLGQGGGTGSAKAVGLEINSGSTLIGEKIKSFSVSKNSNNGNSGNVTAYVYNSSGNVVATSTNTVSSTWSGYGTWNFDGTYTFQADDKLVIYYWGSGYMNVDRNNGGGFDGNDTQYAYLNQSDSWQVYTGFDLKMKVKTIGDVGILKQRFVENFSGTGLDIDRWSTGRDSYNSGIPTFAMSDEIDGGFKVTAQASIDNSSGGIGSASSWAGNNIRQFAHNGSVYIDVFKQNTASSHHKVCTHGFGETLRGDGAGNNASLWLNGVNAGASYFTTRTCNGSGNQSGDVSSDVAYDQNWHNYKIENKSASVEYTLDGVLKTNNTITSNIPQGKMAPISGIQGTSTSTAPSYSIRYVECYNT